MKLRIGDTFTYAGREWTILRVEESSYFAKSPGVIGYSFGYISFAAISGTCAKRR